MNRLPIDIQNLIYSYADPVKTRQQYLHRCLVVKFQNSSHVSDDILCDDKFDDIFNFFNQFAHTTCSMCKSFFNFNEYTCEFIMQYPDYPDVYYKTKHCVQYSDCPDCYMKRLGKNPTHHVIVTR